MKQSASVRRLMVIVALLAVVAMAVGATACGSSSSSSSTTSAGATPTGTPSPTLTPVPLQGGTIVGAGASFPAPLYMKWGEAYNGVKGVKLNYQSIGSGGGIAAIEAKLVDFGASDAPLQEADLATLEARRSCRRTIRNVRLLPVMVRILRGTHDENHIQGRSWNPH